MSKKKKKEHESHCNGTPVQFFGFADVFDQVCNGQSYRLFKTSRDLAALNPSITYTNFSDCPVTFSAEQKNGRVVTTVVNPDTGTNIILPSVVKITATCGDGGGICDFEYDMTYYQCVCCK